MAKGGKSSASSGTRKKHARKAEGGANLPLPLPQKKPKLKKGEKPPPKVKQYIAPNRPAPVHVDPLEALGLLNVLDPELVVILRRLSKKDVITKGKALEELRLWTDGDSDGLASVQMIPVWVCMLSPKS